MVARFLSFRRAALPGPAHGREAIAGPLKYEAHEIISAVCEAAGVWTGGIFAQGRHAEPLRARRACAYLMHHRAGMTIEETARYLQRDKNTTRQMIQKVEADLLTAGLVNKADKALELMYGEA